MNPKFRLNAVYWAICFAFPTFTVSAADAYPPTPPNLSSSVTPNILLHIDNSGSMANRPYSGAPKTKMREAIDVATELVKDNAHLNWGLFSFNPASNQTAGILQAPVGSSTTTLTTAIAGLTASTWTPLGEAAFEMNRYWAGQSSYYRGGVSYTSPIQYRCQKNFNIIITDGVSTRDNWLPGLPDGGGGFFPAVSYTSYDTSGAPVTRNFRACRNTATVSSVTCPANLEGSAVANAFVGTSDDSTSYGRTLRDVAMMSFDRDMRVGGSDLDGKSFDDPLYRKQNVTTFTIGFAVTDPVLQAAATVGGGQYYTAGSGPALMIALNSAIALIGNVVSNAGGGSASGATLSTANKMFQPLFYANGWWGELKCHQLDATGKIGAACTPKAKGVFPGYAARNIVSAKVVGTTTTGFAFNDSVGHAAMTASQRLELGATATDQKKVINFVRGQDVSGFRARPNGVLGDMIDTQPTVIGKPTGYSPDGDYATFKTTHSTREMVFIGANDGMLHGFSTDNMTEFFGYVPTPVYPNLKRLADVNYGNSVTNPHAYFVNGGLRNMDAKLGTDWKTLLVGGLAQGGQGYFALDATSKAGMNASAVKWEFTDKRDSNLGYTFGAPIVYNVRTSASSAIPVVIMANGYESDFADGAASAKNSTLFVIKADDGTVLKKITATGGTGLSAPAGLDVEGDGVLDYVYAGDDSGKVWRFDLTPNDIGVEGGSAPAPVLIFDAGTTKPVIQRPAITQVKSADGTSIVGNLVIFGTGRLLKDADRTDTTVQTMYAVLDKMATGATALVASSSLVERSLESKTILPSADTSIRSGTFRKVSPTPELDLSSDTNTSLGWFVNFPTSSERLITSPMLLSDRLMFGTAIPLTTEKCSSGSGWLMALNPLTGSVAKGSRSRELSFIDVKLDGKSNSSDKVAFDSGDAYAVGIELSGIPGELSVIFKSVAPPTGTSTSAWASSGALVAMQEMNSMAVFGGAGDGAGGTGGAGLPDGKEVAQITVGVKGRDTQDQFSPVPLSGGFKVDASTWRELK
jgi:type IV pilus assembly protein PilY1